MIKPKIRHWVILILAILLIAGQFNIPTINLLWESESITLAVSIAMWVCTACLVLAFTLHIIRMSGLSKILAISGIAIYGLYALVCFLHLFLFHESNDLFTCLILLVYILLCGILLKAFIKEPQ